MSLKLSSAVTLTGVEQAAITTHRSSVGTDHSEVARKTTVHIAGLDMTTPAAEASAGVGGLAASEFVPLLAIAHLEAVGVGAGATGDAAISLGITTPGGTEIIGATVLTNLKDLNDRFVISLAGQTDPIPANSTIYATITTKDTTAGAAHLIDVYVVGHTFVSGT